MKNVLAAIALSIAATLGAVDFVTPQGEITPVLAAEYFNPSALYWQQEVARRYDDAVMIVTHGDTDPETGEWYAYTDVEGPIPMKHLVARVRLANPGRHIVLIACNPDGLRDLDHIPNLSYALASVWMFPDRNSATNLDEAFEDNCVGDIFEFVETY